ncbi:hypothetical protein AGABI2DRAFT_122268 [Agaricus bisporus var. bisporus H97]|uniref:hypothetical protein n=1 Tax=Agaricus bisporus var. bisporus (strain H97 / ATCC MYA-4626 / FGSC 10389) TaxID=936046 RepID=UPI00029F79E7|nr:hypothetical protein AGABI2DRAFT_122268 [Agaricus bisporus var. bisporus H97]EKV42679.1 hypothetical protein AGABI2DRAFT_122268 [Agaricus bisporus var. bisporus H97]
MSANPPLRGPLLLITQLELVSATTAAGTLYGIAFSLYCLYLHASLPQLQDHDRRRQTQFMITISTIIMLCGLYYLVLNAWVIQDAYVKHADFPGGPFVYEGSTVLTQPAIAVGFVCQSVVDISTGAIQIWRLWVVWSGTRYVRIVVVLPVLSLRIRTIFLDITLANEDLVIQDTKTGIAGLALQAITTILPTILIVGFLAFKSRRHRKMIGVSQLPTPYMNIAAMLIESYAVESTWTILFVTFSNLGHPLLQFFSDTQTYVEIIAYLLVQYRVASGRAYGSQRARESQSQHGNISSLHWNHTTTQSDIASGTDTNIQPPGNKPEPEILLVQGSPA